MKPAFPAEPAHSLPVRTLPMRTLAARHAHAGPRATVFSSVLTGALACAMALAPAAARADVDMESARSVVTDSRVKTLLFNDFEVYPLVTGYGYQTYVEFGANETVETISIGDPVGWRLIPRGRRLFIKPLVKGVHTNLSVITDRRAYQFDLFERGSPEAPDAEQAYVIRFFYPDGQWDTSLGRAARPVVPEIQAPMPVTSYNYNYTLSGSAPFAPVQVFDDGRSTFFRFPDPAALPASINQVAASGAEAPLNYRLQGEYIVVDTISPTMTLRGNGATICVFNETMGQSMAAPQPGSAVRPR